ncbi:MAG: hypothetical protein ACRD2N_02555 [Vicinamibacterales bacterium]
MTRLRDELLARSRFAQQQNREVRSRDGIDALDHVLRVSALAHLDVQCMTLALAGLASELLHVEPERSHLERARGTVIVTSSSSTAGADDYLVKPFDHEELRARIHVGLRVLGLQSRLTDRVAELQAALSKVKQLQGLLPICSYCKKVRPDPDYWEQVEDYVAQHTAVKFRHRICPTC